MAEGRLGRKTGGGFYDYVDARRGPVAAQFRLTAGESSMPAADIEADILAAIADEARRALADGVATEADIDLALRLGAGHPVGPFERRAADG